MQKTVVELFAGVGGFRVGLNEVKLKNNKVFQENTWDFVWANQWEPSVKSQHAYNCYIQRFGAEKTSNIDIFEVNKKNIPNHTLLVGGFPCQDYSVAQNLATSKGIEGKKGVLWWAIAEILKTKKPPFVLLENVDRLLISPAKQRGRDFGIILRSFLDNGYAVEWRTINAADYSFPQRRRRVFIFAYHESTNYYKKMIKLDHHKIIFNESIFYKQFKINENHNEFNVSSVKNFKDLLDVSNNFENQFYNSGIMINNIITTYKVNPIIEKIKPLKTVLEKKNVESLFFLDNKKIEKFKYLKGAKKIPRIKPNGEPYFYTEGNMSFPENLNSPGRTLLTSEGGVSRSTHVVEDLETNKLRLLTPVETERLNGFPDNWTNTGMTIRQRNFMMGNALVIGIISKLGKEIEKIIEKED